MKTLSRLAKVLKNLRRSRPDLARLRISGTEIAIDDHGAIYVCFSVKDLMESLNTMSMTEFVKRLRKFVSLLCMDGCAVLISTFVTESSEKYLKSVERMMQNKIVEFEYDRANTRILRELKKLREVHNKILSGHMPLETSTRICLTCKPYSTDEESLKRFVNAIIERVELAARFLGMELKPSSIRVSEVFELRNFRVWKEAI